MSHSDLILGDVIGAAALVIGAALIYAAGRILHARSDDYAAERQRARALAPRTIHRTEQS